MSLEVDGLEQLLHKLQDMDSSLTQEATVWLEGLGFQLLDEVQNEIIRLQVVDTRRLLNSFDVGGTGGIWKLDKQRGVLELEVGTNVEYARWVNDGHWTINPNSGKTTRWVPGYWRGDQFTYDPKAKTGMLLKIKWIEGKKFFDTAQLIFEAMFARSLEKKFQAWIER